MLSVIISPISTNRIREDSSNKKKYKKNALEFVDYWQEYQKDPKFKTELCKSFTDTNFCAYGNKCRFAHGKEDLFVKSVNHPNYRKSDCVTFHTSGFCNYGQRCHFRHNELFQLNDIFRSYFSLLLNMYPYENKKLHRRLSIFKDLCYDVSSNLPIDYNQMKYEFSMKESENIRNTKERLIHSDNIKYYYITNEKVNFQTNFVHSHSHSEQKSNDYLFISQSSISINSITPDSGFINCKLKKINKEFYLNRNLKKKLDFNNYEVIPFLN